MTACDYLICGAGIAGASIACELASHGRVVVAEQEDGIASSAACVEP